MKSTYESLSKIINEPVNTMGDAFELMDVFLDNIYAGFVIPKNISTEIWRNLTFIYNVFNMIQKFGSSEQIKFCNTKFFENLIEIFNQKYIKQVI